MTPPLLLPGQGVLYVHPTPGYASCKPGIFRGPWKKCDPEWVLSTLFPQEPRRPGEGSAACRPKADRDRKGRAHPAHPSPTLSAIRPRGLSSQAQGMWKPTSAASVISRGFS